MNAQVNDIQASTPSESTHAAHGRLGRGAKSAHGRAMSARNATKHGLTCHSLSLLPTEKADIFEEHKNQFLRDLRPADANELWLVTQMIESSWLARRAYTLEMIGLRAEIEIQRDETSKIHRFQEGELAALATEVLDQRNNSHANISRYRIMHQRVYESSLRLLLASRRGKRKKDTSLIEYRSLGSEDYFRAPVARERIKIDSEIPENDSKPPKCCDCNTESEELTLSPQPPTVPTEAPTDAPTDPSGNATNPALPYDQSSFTASDQSRAGEPNAAPNIGAEGATAPETLRPKDRRDCTHLESGEPQICSSPAEEITFSGTKDREGT